MHCDNDIYVQLPPDFMQCLRHPIQEGGAEAGHGLDSTGWSIEAKCTAVAIDAIS